MTESRIDELVAGLTGVRDDLVAGPSTPGARALLTAITSEAPVAAPRRRRYGRSLAGAAVATAMAATAVIALNAGGPAPVREYANAALDIQRTGGSYRVHVKNVYADQREFHEAFAKFGLNVTLLIVPVAPGRERKFIGGSGDGRMATMLDCPPGRRTCPLTVELSGKDVGRSPARILIGRTARPGEAYQYQPFLPGDNPPSLRLTGRTVAEALARLRRENLTVVYRIGDFAKGGGGDLYAPPPGWRPGADRRVTAAWTHSSDSVILMVATAKNDPAPDPNNHDLPS